MHAIKIVSTNSREIQDQEQVYLYTPSDWYSNNHHLIRNLLSKRIPDNSVKLGLPICVWNIFIFNAFRFWYILQAMSGDQLNT